MKKFLAPLLIVFALAACETDNAELNLLAACVSYDRALLALLPHVNDLSESAVELVTDSTHYADGACNGTGPLADLIAAQSPSEVLDTLLDYVEQITAAKAGIELET